MKKNIGKIKQWANERVGGQKTQTTDEFQELQQKTDARHSGIDKLHMATNTYIKIMSKKADSVEEKSKVLPLESLGSTMKIYGEDVGTDTPYGMGLVRFGNANEKIAKAQMEYVSRVRDDFLFGLSSSIEEFKQYQQLKRKLESRRLDYDAKLNKVQKSKKEKPELEEEMRAAKEKYEVIIEDINNKMFALNDSEDQHVQDLTTFLDAQLEYFKDAYEILESVKKDWVECSEKPSSRRKRTPIRSSTIDSANSNSDGANSDNGSADNGSVNSHSSHNRPKPSKRTSKLVKSDSSNNLNIPTGLSRNKSVSSGSSTRSVDLKKPGNTTQKKQVRATFSYEGEDRDELAIEEGDIITVIEEAEGWWIGEIIDEDGTKRSGMFPANYTEPIPVESSPPKIPARRPTNLSRQSSVEQVEEEQESDEEQEDDESDEQTPPKSKRSPPIRQRHSQTSASQRPGSPTAGTPPIPSRSSKPPPARPTSSTSIPPRKAARSSTYEYSSIGNSIPKTTTPPSITSRNSYIQDYVKETTTQDFGPCKECDCNDYSPNVFKKGSCKNCFHIHT